MAFWVELRKFQLLTHLFPPEVMVVLMTYLQSIKRNAAKNVIGALVTDMYCLGWCNDERLDLIYMLGKMYHIQLPVLTSKDLYAMCNDPTWIGPHGSCTKEDLVLVGISPHAWVYPSCVI